MIWSQKNRTAFTSIVVGAAVIVAASLSAGPAQAAERSTDADFHSSAAPSSLSDTTLKPLLEGVDEDSHSFDGEAARAAGASDSEIDAFASGYAAGGGKVAAAKINERVVRALGDIPLAGCSGKNSQDVTGAQVNLYLNSCVTNDVIGAMAKGAGVVALAGLVTSETGIGAVAAVVIAALLSIGGGALTSCNKTGKGVVVHEIVLTGIIWCNGQ